MIGVITEPAALPFPGPILMTKELKCKKKKKERIELCPCHTVTIHLLQSEPRINKLSKAAEVLLSAVPR